MKKKVLLINLWDIFYRLRWLTFENNNEKNDFFMLRIVSLYDIEGKNQFMVCHRPQ